MRMAPRQPTVIGLALALGLGPACSWVRGAPGPAAPEVVATACSTELWSPSADIGIAVVGGGLTAFATYAYLDLRDEHYGEDATWVIPQLQLAAGLVVATGLVLAVTGGWSARDGLTRRRRCLAARQQAEIDHEATGDPGAGQAGQAGQPRLP